MITDSVFYCARAPLCYTPLMTKNGKNGTNGSGSNKQSDDKIIHFPTLAARDKARKEQQKQEDIWRKQYQTTNSNHAPFFNFGKIPPFTKWMTAALLVINIPLLYLKITQTSTLQYDLIYKLGFVPERFTGGMPDVMALITPLSHALLHGDLMHLAFNTVMMLALGMMFEKKFGTKPMIKFFGACVLAGAITFLTLAPNANTPMIGASGGISGLFAAALMLMHGQKPIKMGRLSRYGYWPMVATWLALMLIIGFISGADVAWQAHIGGYVLGAILMHFILTGRLKL